MELIFGVGLCTEKGDFTKKITITTATTQQQPALSHAFQRKFKKEKETTPTTLSYQHSHWTSCEFYSSDSCWAQPVTKNRPRPMPAERWICDGESEVSKERRNGMCVGEKPDGGIKCSFILACITFCRLWRVSESGILMWWVGTDVFEGHRMFVWWDGKGKKASLRRTVA